MSCQLFYSLPYRNAIKYLKFALWYCSSMFQVISHDLLIPEDIGVNTRIVILCRLEFDILVKLQLRISILRISGR